MLTIAGFSACTGDADDVPAANNVASNGASQPSSTSEIDIKSLVSVNSDTSLAMDGISGQPAKPGIPVVINPKSTPSFAITGWAVDQQAQTEAGGVIINIDGSKDVLAKYGQPRPDVAAHLKNTKYTNSGFIATMDASSLAKGRHTLTVRVVTADRKGYFEHKNKYEIEIQ
ncbi:MAG TPA: hypothetical protein VF240_20270 [Pyrinomonadaceae bacterium]